MKQIVKNKKASKAGLKRKRDITAKSVRLPQKEAAERKRMENAFRESEARYRSIYERSMLCIYVNDFDGNFLDANDTALKLLGYSRDEIKSVNFSTLLDEAQLLKALNVTKELKEKGRQLEVAEYKLRRKDGKHVWVETEASILYEDGKPCAVIGIARDISKRKNAEALLVKTEEEKSLILDSILEHLVYHDRDMKVVWANRAAAKSINLELDKLVGQFCYKIGYMRDKPCPDCPVYNAILTGKPQVGEITTSDNRHWFIRGYPVRDEKGAVTGAVEVTLDVTVLKEAENALKESEERFKALTENINVGIYRNTPGSKGKFLEVNRAIVKMFGYSNKEEFLSLNVADTYQNPSDRDKFNEKMLKYGFVKEEILPLKRKDGTPFYGSVSAVAVRDAQGNVRHYDGIIEDITERRVAEQLLEDSYHKLQIILDSTVKALASTAEMRDPYTAGHQQRVTQLACAIAKEMGLPKEKIECIRVASIVHDIGKIHVAGEILNKPIKLADIEMELVRLHCQAGYEILKSIEFPWPIAEIVLQHHERMDGSGYPRGLKGDEILIEARILAVADVIEAMASHRPYRSALSVTDALEEITKFRGTRYDVLVVSACLNLFNKGFTFK